MKKFLGVRKVEEIKKICEGISIPFDDNAYRKSGSDWIRVGCPVFEYGEIKGEKVEFSTAIVSAVNGDFFVTAGGKLVTSRDEWADGHECFFDLMKIIYVPDLKVGDACQFVPGTEGFSAWGWSKFEVVEVSSEDPKLKAYALKLIAKDEKAKAYVDPASGLLLRHGSYLVSPAMPKDLWEVWGGKHEQAI